MSNSESSSGSETESSSDDDIVVKNTQPKRSNDEVKKAIKPKRVRPTPEMQLLSAAKAGDLKTVRACLAKQVNINASEQETRYSPLMLAISFGHRAVVGLFMKQTEQMVFVNNRDYQGQTALHHACIRGDNSTVELLLEAKADASLSDDQGWTPLTMASSTGNSNIAHLLTLGLQKH